MAERRRWRPAHHQPVMIAGGAVHRPTGLAALHDDQLPPVALPARLPPWQPGRGPHAAIRDLWHHPRPRLGQICALTARVTPLCGQGAQLLQWEVHAAVAGPGGALLWACARHGTARRCTTAKAAATRAARAWASTPQRLRWDMPARALMTDHHAQKGT